MTDRIWSPPPPQDEAATERETDETIQSVSIDAHHTHNKRRMISLTGEDIRNEVSYGSRKTAAGKRRRGRFIGRWEEGSGKREKKEE